MKIFVDESSVGVGKTHAAIEKAVLSNMRWLFAVEKWEGIKELESRITAMAKTKGTKPKVVRIMSDPSSKSRMRGMSVKKEIEALPDKYQNGHVIVICSHSAMLMSDFRNFCDWNLVCDEVPSVLDITKMRTKLDVPFFEKYYKLVEVAKGWSAIILTAAGRNLTGSDLAQDDSHSRLNTLHKTVKSFDAGESCKAPVCNLTCWSEMALDKVSWVWWSLFSVTNLKAFQSVTFLASRFSRSFTYKMLKDWDKKVDWEFHSSQGHRQFQQRSVSIFYYSESRKAAKSFFEGDVGRKQLSLIGKHIASVTSPKQLIWSCNSGAKTELAVNLNPNGFRAPRQAGTDTLMNKTEAAMIYAVKPSNEVRQVLKVINADKSAWVETNEREVILQFVSRTSIRDPNSNQAVQIHVYDKQQATYLHDFFVNQSHNSVTIKYEDLNLPSPSKTPGRPTLTPEEAKLSLQRKKKMKRISQWNRRHPDDQIAQQ